MFGTNASLGTDLTLLAEILFFILLTVGVVAQRRGNYKLHDRIQTPVVILNAILVIAMMVTAFIGQRIPQQAIARPNAYYVVAALHGLFGLAAVFLSIYCLLAGWQILPRKLGQLRKVMWATYIVWGISVLLGIAVYYVWYVQQPEPVVLPDPTPTAIVETENTEENGEAVANQPPPPQSIALVNFEFSPGDITIPAGTEVTWTSQDNAPHNVTFADGSFETEDFFAGESAEFTFTDPGTFVIYCTIHGEADGSGMASVVTVAEQSADAEPIAAVTAVPTDVPTEEPTPVPTETPTPEPTEEPVVEVGYDLSFITNAAAQMAIAREHADLMLAAFYAGDLETTRREAEQVINVIDGKAVDHNYDGTVDDPSDGVGLLTHLRNARNQAESADIPPETEADNAIVLDTVNYAIDQLELAINEGITIIEAPAQNDVEALARMVGGADEDGGVQEALAASALVADPGTVVEVEIVPTAEPTPEPVVFTIDMEDFEFVSNNATIKVGTTVTWVNVGDAPHSAQADDGTFDTTIFESGEERSFTFDAPGTYAYFCELHGASEGRGMSGVIVVEE